MNKRFLQVISAALCVLLLAGCGTKAEDSAGTADNGQQWGPPAQDGFDEPVYRTTIFGSMPYEAPPRRADKVWDGAAWVDPSDPEVTQRTAVEPDVTVTTQWAEGQQGEDGIADAVRDYMTLAYSLRAAPDMTVEEHPCCTDDMVDELRFYAFMMSSDLSFRTRAAATLENLTPSASDNIRVRVLIDAQEATGNITDTAYCQDEHWSTARELALTRLDGRWTVTDDDTDASNFFQGGVADEVPPSRELRQAVEERFYQAEVTPELGIVANARQKQCLEQAREQVQLALDALDAGEMLDAVTVLLEEAADALLTLTGERVSEAVVNDVFSRFCVGK